jgi:hypothetical protein
VVGLRVGSGVGLGGSADDGRSVVVVVPLVLLFVMLWVMLLVMLLARVPSGHEC